MRSTRRKNASRQTGRFLSRGPGRSAILTVFLALIIALIIAAPVTATETSNRAFTPRTVQMKVTQVRSGHEILSGGFKVRLHGIAAPRFGTKLGTDAVFFLNTLILNRTVGCRLTGLAFRDMEVGTCRIGGRDIAELLVREGLALPCPKLGGRLYTSDAKRAKNTGIEHSFVLPAYCGEFRGSEM